MQFPTTVNANRFGAVAAARPQCPLSGLTCPASRRIFVLSFWEGWPGNRVRAEGARRPQGTGTQHPRRTFRMNRPRYTPAPPGPLEERATPSTFATPKVAADVGGISPEPLVPIRSFLSGTIQGHDLLARPGP